MINQFRYVFYMLNNKPILILQGRHGFLILLYHVFHHIINLAKQTLLVLHAKLQLFIILFSSQISIAQTQMKRQQITNTQKLHTKKLFANASDIFAQIKSKKSQKKNVDEDSHMIKKTLPQINLVQVLKLHKLNPVLTIPKDFQQYINIFQQYAEFDVHLEKSASRQFCQKNYRHIYIRFLETYCSLKQAQIREIDQNKTLTDWMDWLENNVVFRHPNTIKKQQIVIPQYEEKTQASNSKDIEQPKDNTSLQKLQIQAPILKSQPSIQDLSREYKQTMAKRKEKFQIKKQPKNSNRRNKKQSKRSQQKNKTQQKKAIQKKSRQKNKEQSFQKPDKSGKRGRKKKTQIKKIEQQYQKNIDQLSSLSIRSSQIERLRIQSSQQKKQQKESQSQSQLVKKVHLEEISKKQNQIKLDDSEVEIQKSVSIIQVIEISEEEPQKNQFKAKLSDQSSGVIVENERGNRFKRESQDQNSLSRGRFLLSTTPPCNLKRNKNKNEFDLISSFDLEKKVEDVESQKEEDNSNTKIKYNPKLFNTMKRLSACLANQQLRYYIMPEMVKHH